MSGHDISPSRPYVSVIVPVCDNPTGLASLLDALGAQTYPRERFEVLIVDNGSQLSPAQLRRRHRHAKWLFEPAPGSYRARNRGIREAQGEIIAFTDSDCVPQAGWIECGVRALMAAGAPAMVAGRIDIVPGNLARVSICELYDIQAWLPQDQALSDARFGATANLFTTRATLDRVGVFDERLLSGGDREWGNRVHRAGLPQSYAEDAVVLHPARRTLREVIDRGRRVTVSTMVAGPDASYSLQYFRRHLIARPRAMWTRMAARPARVGWPKRFGVLALYFTVKATQAVERIRARAGKARKQA